LAESDFAQGLVVGLLIGIFVGLPAGWVIATTLTHKGDIVAFERDEKGNIKEIVEKPL
jgi:hypothetical protein